MTSPLEQCRDALKPCPFCGAKPGTLARPDNIDGSEFYAAVFCHCDGYSATAHVGRRSKTQDEATSAAHAIWNQRAAAEAALAAQPEPVAWAQLGMRNGHTYVRMHYEGHLYPPPPDVQRNLNLVPLYAAPVAAPVAQPQPIPKERLALNVQHKDCHKAADAFWTYWNENGETHKRGYYESTWGAINRALRTVGVVEHDYPAAPKEPA